MQTDQLNGLIALKAVADTRNFSAAARNLRISTSAVSQAVKQLEQRLGVALLSRTTRSTNLTEAGERFLADAGPALDQILAAMESVGNYAKRPSGLLRLNMPKSIFATHLAGSIASFSKKYPEIQLELCFEDATIDIVGRGFDAGIRLSDILAKDVVALKVLGAAQFVTCASPEYLKNHGRPKHPKDLLQHNCILMRLGQGVYDRWDFETKGKDFQVQVKGNCVINDSTLAGMAAIHGMGVVYHLRDAVTQFVKDGKLEIILENYSATSEGFYLYYPKASQVLPKLRAFIDHLKDEAKATAGR